MGILEELAGAAAAVVATKKLDPGAGLLTEGLAAITGFKGVEALTGMLGGKSEEANEDEAQQPAARVAQNTQEDEEDKA